MTTVTATNGAAAPQTTALVAPTANPGRELEFYGLDREKIELLKRTVAKGTTDDQFALFMTIAQRRRLDPFAKQIWCVLRKGKSGLWEMTAQTSIDGYRLIAQRTGEYDGQDGPWWCGEDGVWKDVWLSKAPPKAAKVVAYRKGVSHPATGIAHLESFAAYKDDGKTLEAKWAQMPEHMLAKCAETLALRKAFPEELSGLNTEDEMDHANAIDVPSVERIVTAKPAEPEADPWVPFLAELATVPGAAQFADGFGTPVTAWTEGEITEAWTGIIGEHETRRALNEALGPWAAIVDRHAKVSSRVAKLKDAVGALYKARTAQLRAAEQSAQNGGQS